MPLESPGPVMEKLEQIENEMALLANDWTDAAKLEVQLKRDYKLRLAIALRALKNTDLKVAEKAAAAELAVEEQDDLAERLNLAEATVIGCKTAFSVLERRASIGQSILRAMTQEAR